MSVLRLALLFSLLALPAMGQQAPQQIPASCPVTVAPATPFTPPSQYELVENGNSFWLGTEKLWTALGKSKVWATAPRPRGHEQEVQPLTAKTFWGSVDFNYREEYPPKLKVTGRRLDGPTLPLLTMTPTNAFPGPAVAMLVGVYVPAPGCWEITGEYKGAKLSYIIWVRPAEHLKQ